MPPSLVLINPWIYDFAAYDLWSKPLGLLYLGSFLRERGFHIHLIDCLDVHHPAMSIYPSGKRPKRRLHGTGKYWRHEVPRPLPLDGIERPYSYYGISHEAFLNELGKIKKPAAFLVTSIMTYWYPGVQTIIAMVKETFPDVPIILGGIYARLCRDHAILNSGADHVVTESGPSALMEILGECGVPDPASGPFPETLPYPAFDLLSKPEYICLRTSRGCPYRCQYCASPFLDPKRSRRNPAEVVEEILYWHNKKNIKDFAFYDDALLVNSDTHLAVILNDLASLGLKIRFHTPNALHIREITPELAQLMRRTGFTTIRLGLETLDFPFRDDLDDKVAEGDFERALAGLHNAGFGQNEIGVYVLIGLPGQSLDSVFETIEYVNRVGAYPFLAEYSPVPHTALWEKAVRSSQYDLVSEPLFHNNTLLPCWENSQKREISKLKHRIREIRHPIVNTN